MARNIRRRSTFTGAGRRRGLAPGPVLVVLLGRNLGPARRLAGSGFLRSLPRHFCLTDPDLALNPALPADFCTTLMRVTENAGWARPASPFASTTGT